MKDLVGKKGWDSNANSSKTGGFDVIEKESKKTDEKGRVRAGILSLLLVFMSYGNPEYLMMVLTFDRIFLVPKMNTIQKPFAYSQPINF